MKQIIKNWFSRFIPSIAYADIEKELVPLLMRINQETENYIRACAITLKVKEICRPSPGIKSSEIILTPVDSSVPMLEELRLWLQKIACTPGNLNRLSRFIRNNPDLCKTKGVQKIFDEYFYTHVNEVKRL